MDLIIIIVTTICVDLLIRMTGRIIRDVKEGLEDLRYEQMLKERTKEKGAIGFRTE